MIRKIFCIAICALALIACNKTQDGLNGPESVVVTGEALDVTSSSATMVAYYNTTRYMHFDYKRMYYSTSPDVVTTGNYISCPTEERGRGGYFKVIGLQPATTYYYCAYVLYYYVTTSDQNVFGEVKSFTTLAE